VVGEVVRFADATESGLSLPTISASRGSELLTALFAQFPSNLLTHEEPIA